MFVAFGLWNVLLLPFSIVELGATEFEYGLQEGLTSVGFVVGSLFMARLPRSCPKRPGSSARCWRWASCGIGYALSTDRAGGDPARDAERVRPAAVIGLARGPAPAPHAARDARPGLLRLLRHARRDLPHRHGRRRPGRHRRHPAADRLRVEPAVRVGGVHPVRARASGSARGGRRPRRLAPAAGGAGHGRAAVSRPRPWPTSTGSSARCRRSRAWPTTSGRRSSTTRRSARSRPGPASSSTATSPRTPTSSSTASASAGRPRGGRLVPRAVDDAAPATSSARSRP